MVLAIFCCSRRSKIEDEIDGNRVEYESKIKCAFEADFFQKTSDFEGILGMKIDPKWKKRLLEKRSDFEANAEAS